MQRHARLLAVFAVFVLPGCASTDDASADARPEKVYRTGSNIPQRDHGMHDSVQTREVNPADSLGLPMAGRLPSSTGGR